MLNLYTEEYSLLPRLKGAVKIILGRRTRGPQGVFESLSIGLKRLGVDFSVNSVPEHVRTACVLSGVQTLKAILEAESQGTVDTIVAGPNIVVMPYSENNLIQNDYISTVIVPSQWVKDKYAELAPKISHKVRIWPAGVEVPQVNGVTKDNDFIIYNKIGDSQLFHDIRRHLEHLRFSVETVTYGSFKRADYFALLERSKYMVYLSQTESQGIAMFEAWARGVPTLVWERGFFELDGYRLEGLTASPWLHEVSGLRFQNYEEFRETLPHFLQGNFHPREYVLENFTHEKSARKYLEAIGQH